MVKIYSRVITRREPINRFGKLGYVPYREILINPSEEVYAQANYKKHIRFAFNSVISADLSSMECVTDYSLKLLLQDYFKNDNIDIVYNGFFARSE